MHSRIHLTITFPASLHLALTDCCILFLIPKQVGLNLAQKNHPSIGIHRGALNLY